MAKIVYDPTQDRKHKNVKVFQAASKHGEKPKTVIYDSKVPPKGKAVVKKGKRQQATAETEKPKKPTFTDEQFLETLKEIGHPATSREISDKLGIKDADKGRQMVRTRMAKLIAEKKVVAVESEKKNIGKLYKLPP